MDQTRIKKMVDDHWKYVESILSYHGLNNGRIRMCAFYYKDAMRHGYKHGWDDARNQNELLIS